MGWNPIDWLNEQTALGDVNDWLNEQTVMGDANDWLVDQGIGGRLGLNPFDMSIGWDPLSMPDIPIDSPTYETESPYNTIKEGLPISRSYGRCLLAGNVIRNSDPQEENIKMIVAHCVGEIDEILSWKLNNQEITRMESIQLREYRTGTTTQKPISEIEVARGETTYEGESALIDVGLVGNIYSFLGIGIVIGDRVYNLTDDVEAFVNYIQSTQLGLDSNIFTIPGKSYSVYKTYFQNQPMAYRGIAYTAFYLKKDNQITSIPSVLSIGRWMKCTPIAVNIRRPAYQWETTSTANEYECQISGGGDPELLRPVTLYIDGMEGTESTAGNLGLLGYKWSWQLDSGTSTYNTVRIYHLTDPDLQANGYVKYESANVFSRNPAVVLWDFYRNVEEQQVNDLDELGFKSLETLCDVYPTTSDGAPLRPPGPGKYTVKATSAWGDEYISANACDIDSSMDGSSVGNAWNSANGTVTNQRFNVDLGIPGILTKIVLINHYNSEAPQLTNGIQNFVIQASNDSTDFSSVVYDEVAAGTGWSGVSAGGVAIQYDSAAVEQTHRITTPPTTAYRYYSLKIADNLGGANFMGFRDVNFWIRNPRYTFDFNFDNKTTINDAKKLIWKSFNGAVIKSQGKFKPVWDWSTEADGAGDLTTKAVRHAFTEDNIVLDSFTWSPIDRPNIITVNYLNSHDNFRKDSVTLKDEADIGARGEVPWDETCLYITSTDVARRRCQVKMNKARYADYRCFLIGLSDSQDVEISDLTTVTHQLPGWTNKQFIVVSKNEDLYGRPAFTLEAYHSGMFGDQVAPIDASYRSWLPTPFGKPFHVTDVDIADSSYFDANGKYHISVIVSYTKPRNSTFWKGAMFQIDFGDAWASDNLQGESAQWAEHVTDSGWETNYTTYTEDRSLLIDGDTLGIKIGDTFRVRIVSVNENGTKADEKGAPTKSFKVGLPNIKAHIDRMPNAGGRMVLPEGTYTLPSGGLLMPNKSIDIQGVNKDLVLIKNVAGSSGFRLINLSSTFGFSNFRMHSQNAAAYSNMFDIIGSTAKSNTSDVTIANIQITLADDGIVNSDGDIGISSTLGDSNLVINYCKIIGGKTGVAIGSNKVSIQGSVITEQTTIGVDITSTGEGALQIGANSITQQGAYGIKSVSSNSNLTITNNVVSTKTRSPAVNNTFYSIYCSANESLTITGNSCLLTQTGLNMTAYGIYVGGAVATGNHTIDQNWVNLVVGASTGNVKGIVLEDVSDSTINSNKILVNDTDATGSHYGIHFLKNAAGSSRNTASSNNIDMVNADATKDIGIKFDVDCNNNKAKNNTILNYGLGNKYADSGTGNAWTVIDGQITVSLNEQNGDFLDIPTALSKVSATYGKIFLRNGTYTDVLLSLANIDTEIVGESQGGVIIQNVAASGCFILDTTSKKYTFRNFSISSQNVASYSTMISMLTTSSGELNFEDLTIDLADAGTWNGDGDVGIGKTVGLGKVSITNVDVNDGQSGVYIDRHHADLNITNCTLIGQKRYGIYAKVAEDYTATVQASVRDFWLYGIYVEDQVAEF